MSASGTVIPCSSNDATQTPADPSCTVAVSPGGDDQGNIKSALINAQSGDVICLNSGRFELSDQLTLDASGVTATVGPGNLDLALSVNGRYLYQLRGSGPITALRVESDGHLTTLGVVGNMPGSVAGLAAR